MADVTEVIHRISYDIDNRALENATALITKQVAELYKLKRILNDYTHQLGTAAQNETGSLEDLRRKIAQVNKDIATTSGKSEGLLRNLGQNNSNGSNFHLDISRATYLTEQQRKHVRGAVADYQSLAQAAAEAYNSILQVQIDALDKEISLREKRLEEAKKLAERGNTEALRLEEERLRKAQQQREQFARRQQAVNAAITVSNAIAAVARAALEGGGFGSIATIAALIAALAAGYAAVTSLSNDSGDSFADGVIDYKGKGGPRDDKNWVRISTGESVITAEGTKKNRALLEAINKGAALHMVNPALPLMMPEFKLPVANTANGFASTADLKRLEGKLDEVVGAIEDNKMKQNIFFNEQGVGIMTERAIQKDRRRWK